MERTEYQETYPNYCKSCQGWGAFKSPYGRSEGCKECITKGVAPAVARTH